MFHQDFHAFVCAMSSFFSCLGKKSKAKKKKNGKPPESKIVDDPPKDEGDKEHPIEEYIPADKEVEPVCEEKEPVECSEEPVEETPLIKELKSKLSIKTDKSPVQEQTHDDKENNHEEKQEVSEIIEKSAITSVGAEIGKLEAKAKDDTKKLLKSDSLSEKNFQLSEENQRLRKKCDENVNQMCNQRNEIQKLQEECSALKARFNEGTKLENAIQERRDIMLAVEELTNVCASLKMRLDEVENEKDRKSNAPQNFESKINTIDIDHEELSCNIKNTLRCVQELECRVINLELDKENGTEKKDDVLSSLQERDSPAKTQDNQQVVVALEKQVSKLLEEAETLKKENKELKNKSSNENTKQQLKELKSLEKQVEQLNADVSKLGAENTQLKNQLAENNAQKDLVGKCKTLESTVENQKMKIMKMIEENESLKKEVTSLKMQTSKTKSLQETIESQNKELAQLMEENKMLMEKGDSESQMKNMQQLVDKLNAELEKLKEKNTQLENEAKLGKEENGNKLQNQTKSMESEIKTLQKQCNDLQSQLEESLQSHRSKDERLSSLQNTERNHNSTITCLESKLTQYEARQKSGTEEVVVLKKKLEKIERQLREKEIAHQDTIKKLAEAQKKQEEFQKRLTNGVPVENSHTMNGSALVTSLSNSENGPIRIGEKFRELFDTVWRETFERLHSVCNRDERKVLLILMEYLTECYLYCRRTARHQMDVLFSLLVTPTNLRGSLNKRIHGKPINAENIPDALKQDIMVFRRSPSENFIENLFEEFMNVLDYPKSRHLRNIHARDIAEVTPFVRKCIGVCWEMVTQEPPMYLLFKLRHNQIIEKDKFDVFSNDGNKVDYLVWPALLRDENGHLLQKGVVQAIRS